MVAIGKLIRNNQDLIFDFEAHVDFDFSTRLLLIISGQTLIFFQSRL